jgi:hypothetical protein
MGQKNSQVYALIDPLTLDVRYVGMSVDAKKRFTRHLHLARKSHHHHLYYWIRSLLRQEREPILEILEDDLDRTDVGDRERFWIAYFKDQGCDLTNMNEGGLGGTFALTTEERKAIWDIRRARYGSGGGNRGSVTSETAKKIWKTRKRRYGESGGNKKSWETRREKYGSSGGNVGHVASEETRKRIGEASKGRKHSEETKAKIAEASRRRTGWTHSEEAKRRISEGTKRGMQRKRDA